MKPVASMTGFAVATRPTAIGPVAVELKSVNSRFLDLSVRYPDELRSVEAALREAISARVDARQGRMPVGNQPRRRRGRRRAESGSSWPASTRLAAEVATEVPGIGALQTVDVLGWPGVVDAPVADPDALRAAVLDALGEALAASPRRASARAPRSGTFCSPVVPLSTRSPSS